MSYVLGVRSVDQNEQRITRLAHKNSLDCVSAEQSVFGCVLRRYQDYRQHQNQYTLILLTGLMPPYMYVPQINLHHVHKSTFIHSHMNYVPYIDSGIKVLQYSLFYKQRLIIIPKIQSHTNKRRTKKIQLLHVPCFH